MLTAYFREKMSPYLTSMVLAFAQLQYRMSVIKSKFRQLTIIDKTFACTTTNDMVK